MSKEPCGCLVSHYKLNSYVHRVSKERKENQCQRTSNPPSHLCWCLYATFPMANSLNGLCPGLFPYPNILYHRVPFRCLISSTTTSTGKLPSCTPLRRSKMLALFYSGPSSVLYWLTALRLLPHEIHPRSIQCHFRPQPEHDVVMR